MLTTKHGSLAPGQMKFLAILLCLSIVLIPVGLFLLFAEQGAQFKPEEKLYRHYTGIWGLNFGKWKSYEAFTDMALLTARMTSTTYSRANVSTSQSEVVHELYLLTPNHRSKLLAYVFKNKLVAEKANPVDLASALGVKFTAYSPKISAQTLARRRR